MLIGSNPLQNFDFEFLQIFCLISFISYCFFRQKQSYRLKIRLSFAAFE